MSQLDDPVFVLVLSVPSLALISNSAARYTRRRVLLLLETIQTFFSTIQKYLCTFSCLFKSLGFLHQTFILADRKFDRRMDASGEDTVSGLFEDFALNVTVI